MKTILVVLALAAVAPTVRAANGVAPGQFVIEPATLICFGFEWDITGDDNRNATVEVSYRVSGQTAWIDGMPLLRMGGERIMRAPYTVPDRFAGSILDLQPGTQYDVRLTMKDPDGVSGTAVQNVKVRTRAEPTAAAGGRAIHVYPLTWPASAEREAELHGPHGRVRRVCRHGRLECRRAHVRRSLATHSRPCGSVQGRSAQLRRSV